MIQVFLMLSIQFYLNKIKNWFKAGLQFLKSNWGWFVTAVTALCLLAYLFMMKKAENRPRTAAELSRIEAKSDLKVLEHYYKQVEKRAAAMDHKDEILNEKAKLLARAVVQQKAYVANLEAGRKLDWDSLSDAEIDARFKAAGL